MTNKKQQITTIALATILIVGSFSLTPFAYSTGWNDDDDDNDNDHNSNQQVQKGFCDDTDNLLTNGCFETPVVTNSKKWDVYNSVSGWTVNWLIDENNDATDGINPCQTGEPGLAVAGYLELQKGILGGPSEGAQHAELDSDCNGPTNNARSGEKSSVGISQSITTSEMNDYKITFAYKARPDQPLSTNGLMVSWNGDDITPNNLDFSKKKWKYASITVSVAAEQDLSTLVFEDTGNPDSFGTFLDDVSVKAIPKPVIKITLNKEIDNSQGGTITDPNAFGLKINDLGVSHGVENIYSTAGTFSISEIGAPNYVGTLIASENCPFESLGNTAELELSNVVECTISNTFVPPPTITVYHAVTQDNDGVLGPYASEFNLSVDDTPVTDTDKTVEVVAGVASQIKTNDVDGYSFVLIAGDTKCPTNLEENIILESGDHINCWVYHDDDFVEGQSGGEGIIFQRNSMQVLLGDNTAFDSCDKTLNPSEKDPCIEIINADAGIIGIVDSALTSDQTIVLYSVIEANRLESKTGAINPTCEISAITQHNKESFFLRDSDSTYPSNPTAHNVVVLKCTGMIKGATQDPDFPDDPTKLYEPTYNVNYVMVDPTV